MSGLIISNFELTERGFMFLSFVGGLFLFSVVLRLIFEAFRPHRYGYGRRRGYRSFEPGPYEGAYYRGYGYGPWDGTYREPRGRCGPGRFGHGLWLVRSAVLRSVRRSAMATAQQR